MMCYARYITHPAPTGLSLEYVLRKTYTPQGGLDDVLRTIYNPTPLLEYVLRKTYTPQGGLDDVLRTIILS